MTTRVNSQHVKNPNRHDRLFPIQKATVSAVALSVTCYGRFQLPLFPRREVDRVPHGPRKARRAAKLDTM